MKRLFSTLMLFFLFFFIKAEEYGVKYLPSISYEGNKYYCVFAPLTRVKFHENESWRWDSCVKYNPEIMTPHTTYFYQENFNVTDGFLRLENVLAYGRTSNYTTKEFDCDITDCLNPLISIDYTGFAICAKEGKQEDMYFVFNFIHDKLVSVKTLSWKEFERFVEINKIEGGCVHRFLLVSGWLNWGRNPIK